MQLRLYIKKICSYCRILLIIAFKLPWMQALPTLVHTTYAPNPCYGFHQFHTVTKNTGASVPRLDRPWKKGCHIQRRSHGKRGDRSNFRATDKQHTYSTPAYPTNIAPTSVVQVWISTEKHKPVAKVQKLQDTWISLLLTFQPSWTSSVSVADVSRLFALSYF